MFVSRVSPMVKDATILVTGGRGLVGSALVNALREAGFTNVVAPSHAELELTNRDVTQNFFAVHKPRYVFHLASMVFGLVGNMKNQIESLSQNTVINNNLIMACAHHGVKKVFFAGTVASYPFPYKALPLREDYLWEGSPHYGEYGYANAKRHALSYLEILSKEKGMDYCYGLLTNMYGPNDKFDPQFGHVIPSLVKKLDHALVEGADFCVWGDGTAKRDFLFIEDAARAIIACQENLSGVVNIASGETVTIRDVVEALVEASGYAGPIVWEKDKPVGIPERSIDTNGLKSTGFTCHYDLRTGLKKTWDWYVENRQLAR